MSEIKERCVESIESKLFVDILKIVKKLNLVKTDKDDYDHLSATYELEKLYIELEQQNIALEQYLRIEKEVSDETIRELEQQNKQMLEDLIYFVKRVKNGSVRSTKTYNRYIETIESVTGKKIEEVLK